jgi:hypothetical protein
MTADVRSMSVKQLRREIKRIAARLHKSASMDELDRAWATLCRMQDALALATERAKSLAD